MYGLFDIFQKPKGLWRFLLKEICSVAPLKLSIDHNTKIFSFMNYINYNPNLPAKRNSLTLYQ